MATLTEKKFLLVQQYAGLLEMIQEAFEHIVVCFKELRYEGAMGLWEDILLAFSQIDDSHSAISDHFSENPVLLDCFEQFEKVLETTELLGQVDDILQVDQIISKKNISGVFVLEIYGRPGNKALLYSLTAQSRAVFPYSDNPLQIIHYSDGKNRHKNVKSSDCFCRSSLG